MNKATIVIGAGHGDEGKGLMTDFHSNKDERSIVVRHNGGAQAGHTVTLPDGRRHVFSHFGSGTLNGSPTFLSEHFVCNPMLFEKELKELIKLGHGPSRISTHVHADCLVTTPYDMLINQHLEGERGDDNHGSVGVGFGETIERSEFSKINGNAILTVRDLFCLPPDCLKNTLNFIRSFYVQTRLKPETLNNPILKSLLESDLLLSNFMKMVERFCASVEMVDDYSLLKDKPLVFEGSQGLLLDPEYGLFPHVTRSSCGTKNAAAILDQIDHQGHVDVVYVSRAYSTRHGAGPLLNENIELPFEVVDATNKHNEFQGSLRTAPLNIELLHDVIRRDFRYCEDIADNAQIAVTCVDQMLTGTEGMCRTQDGIELWSIPSEVFHDMLRTRSNYCSYGPTREDVVTLSDA